MIPLVVKGHFRANYLCTQCLGENQPKDGPDADLLVVMHLEGEPDDEEYVCKPCAERIAAGGPFKKLVIEVPKAKP